MPVTCIVWSGNQRLRCSSSKLPRTFFLPQNNRYIVISPRLIAILALSLCPSAREESWHGQEGSTSPTNPAANAQAEGSSQGRHLLCRDGTKPGKQQQDRTLARERSRQVEFQHPDGRPNVSALARSVKRRPDFVRKALRASSDCGSDHRREMCLEVRRTHRPCRARREARRAAPPSGRN